MISKENLEGLGIREEYIALYLDHLNATMVKYEIVYPMRVCHFLAQVLHESGRLRYTTELSSGSQYNDRKDLGNTEEGDGPLFKGSGFLQLTGRSNFQSYANYLNNQEIMSNPKLVSEPEFACDSAAYFWSVLKKDSKGNNMNSYADDNNFIRICYGINGSFVGISERWTLFKKCLYTLDNSEADAKIKQIKDRVAKNLTDTDRTPMWNLLLRFIPNIKAVNDILS